MSGTDHTTHWKATLTGTGTISGRTTTTSTITGLPNGTAFRVRIRATNLAQHSAWVEASATPAEPAVPEGLDVRKHPTVETSLSVRWDRVQYATAYGVRWRVKGPPAGSWTSNTSVDTAKGTSFNPFDITGLMTETEYEVQVRSTVGSDHATWSTAVSATPGAVAIAPGIVWSATLNPAAVTTNPGAGTDIGCNHPNDCSMVLSPSSQFTVAGKTFRIDHLRFRPDTQRLFLRIQQTDLDARSDTSALQGLNFCTGSASIPMSGAGPESTIMFFKSGLGLGWTQGTPVKVHIATDCRLVPAEASISVSPNPIREGSKRLEGAKGFVTVTLDKPWKGDRSLSIPLSAHGATGHWYIETSSVGISYGETSGKTLIATREDDDTVDETFTLGLDTVNLPAGVSAGATTSVTVTIDDNDDAGDPAQAALPTVTLSATPNPVTEGSPLTVTATLSAALASDVTIPVNVNFHTAEFDDVGTYPLNIIVAGGGTSASGTLVTHHDSDNDDERFSIAVTDARLPLGLATGHPHNVAVTIDDDEPQQQNPDGAGRPTAVTLVLGEGVDAAQQKTVGEDAGDVTLTATVDAPAPDGGMTFRLVPHPDGTATRDIDYTMPNSIAIPAGERSATAVIRVTDDALDESDETANLIAVYTGLDGDLTGRATLTITDDDTAGVTMSAASPAMSVAEGGTATYTVVLDSQPTADVTITPTSDDGGAATVSPASHTFTPSAWNTPLTFTVSGVADTDTNDESVSVSHGVTSDDMQYNNLLVSTVSVTVSDTTTEQQQAPQAKYAGLIAKIKQWRDDPCCASNKAHTDRWDRTLLTFGETVADTTLTVMTATEAQTYADRGWTRWVEVAQALRELENLPPTVTSAIADITIVNENGTLEVSLSGVFSDADNDSLTITAGSDDETVATVSVAADQSSLTVSAYSRGSATITVTASDGKGGTVSDEFTVKVKAAPAVANAISDVSSLEAGASRDVSLSGVFSEADGDTLTVSAASSNDAIATVTVAVDQSKLTVAGVAQGTATITVTAQDSDGNTVSDAFDVTVAAPQQQPATPNNAPTVASAIGDATIVNESGTQQVSLSGVFSDADNDALTISAASSDEAKATVSVAGDYATLTVTAKSRGTATITVTANDGKGGTVSDAFTVKVKAAPVVASAISDVSALEVFGVKEISLSGVFSDADDDSLTLSAASSDSTVVEATLYDEELTIFGLEEGTATITVTAKDADGNTVTDTFDVTVLGPPSVVANLRCIAETGRVAFLWEAPEWSGGDVYVYDYELTLPDGRSEGGRLKDITLLLRPGTYQAGNEASVSVTTVYELSDGSNVSSAEETLTCTVA